MPQLRGQPRQERRVVAVADERLRRPRRIRLAIEQRQQLDAAVAAADGDERRDRRVRPGRAAGRRATSAGPARYARRSNTLSSYTGSNPSARSSATPASNSSRANGLAGATTATRSPGAARAASACARRTAPFRRRRPGARRARAAARSAVPVSGRGGGGARKRSLTRRWRVERILDALERQRPVLDRVDHRLERRDLRLL